MTIAEYIELAASRLSNSGLCFGHGTARAIDEAFFLILGALNLDLDDEFVDLQRPLHKPEQVKLDALLLRRIEQRIPVAYLLGFTQFAGHRFYTDERALIPRSPIAELIVQQFEPLLNSTPEKVLDLCAGGGCLGIASALEIAAASVDLVDISAPALDLARKNVAAFELEHRVNLIQSDLFENVGDRYDLIICNPPYVSASELADLPAEYRHEPELGLYSDENGLALPIQVLHQSADYLLERGLLILEVGYSWEALAARFQHIPFLWLEFNCGGEGVLVMNKQQLLQYRGSFI